MKFHLRAARILPLIFVLAAPTALAAAPRVTLSPASNHPQGTTKVSGSGFGRNAQVDIYFDTVDEVLVVTDGSGNLTQKIGIPASALPGTHWVTAIQRSNGAAAQSPFMVQTRWQSYGFDAVGRRRNPYENVIDPSNVGTLDLAWSASTGDDVVSSPAIAQITGSYDPYIFVGSGNGNVYAFDSTRALVWKKPTGGAVVSSPAVSGNIVYAGSGDGKLYAFNAADGTPAWASPATTGGAIDSSPAVASGIVYVGSTDGKLYAFKARTGAAAWPSPAVTGGAIGFSSPAVAEGTVYIGSDDGKLYAFDAATGASAWAAPFATGGMVDSSPAVAAGVVYFGSDDHDVYAVNAKTGALKWSVATGSEVNSSPAVANGTVYIGSDKLYALTARNGAIRWTGALAGLASYSSAAFADGVVYIGTTGDDVEGFNASGCGASACLPLWSASTGDEVDSSPAVSDGVVYVGSNDNRLYAFALNAGNNAAYKFRKSAPPPSYASLHPDMRLKPVRH